jgi:hypothetical protein
MLGLGCALAWGEAEAAKKPGPHCAAVVVERKTFDPKDSNKGGAPIKGQEAAVTVAEARSEIAFSSEKAYTKKVEGGFEAGVKINSANFKVSMKIIVWLPQGAGEWLKEHEETHRQIYQKVYETLAEGAAVKAGKDAAGKTFVGTGKTAAEAERDALVKAQAQMTDEYTANASAVWARVNDLFDIITKHGSLSIPGMKDGVSAESGMQRAYEAYANQVDAVEEAKKLAGGAATQKGKGPATRAGS